MELEKVSMCAYSKSSVRGTIYAALKISRKSVKVEKMGEAKGGVVCKGPTEICKYYRKTLNLC